MIFQEENMEQRLIDAVCKTHNLACGIFGNISDDLGALNIPELSPLVRMAYAYARRFAAAGLYVQGVFSHEQYMYICTVFFSYQVTTAKDACLRPGEDVPFQEEALKQAAELLITYDHRFNISFIQFFGTALYNQGTSFPVLPNGSSYEMAVNVIERQIAAYVNSSLSNNLQVAVTPPPHVTRNSSSGFYAGNTVRVDKIGYLVMAFFVGSFGVHKFYAGQVGYGIIYLLMCLTSFLVIPVLILMVCVWWEIIEALLAKTDEKGRITLKAGFINTRA